MARTTCVHARVITAARQLCPDPEPGWQWRLHVYDESSAELINAHAICNSDIMIASGLVSQCRSDDELAGAMQVLVFDIDDV